MVPTPIIKPYDTGWKQIYSFLWEVFEDIIAFHLALAMYATMVILSSGI